MNTVISRRPTPFTYTKWLVDHSKGTCIPQYSITINGGAGVSGGSAFARGVKESSIPMFTPEGVATIVDDKTLDKLIDVPKFKKDIERGLIRVIKGKSITDQEKLDNEAEKHMADKDDIQGRQLTADDFKDAGAIENKDGSWNVEDADTRPASEIRKTMSRRRRRR
jgi:hypothetical protein